MLRSVALHLIKPLCLAPLRAHVRLLLGIMQDIKRWRESEITHGRVAMLAALG
jgi:hypothetical protein